MARELAIIKDGKVVARVPLREPGEDALGEEEIEDLLDMHAFASNAKRMQALIEMASREWREMRFTDFITITGNPKLASDCTSPMMDRGLLIHEKRAPYTASKKGKAFTTTMTTGIEDMMKLLEELFGNEEGGEDE